MGAEESKMAVSAAATSAIKKAVPHDKKILSSAPGLQAIVEELILENHKQKRELAQLKNQIEILQNSSKVAEEEIPKHISVQLWARKVNNLFWEGNIGYLHELVIPEWNVSISQPNKSRHLQVSYYTSGLYVPSETVKFIKGISITDEQKRLLFNLIMAHRVFVTESELSALAFEQIWQDNYLSDSDTEESHESQGASNTPCPNDCHNVGSFVSEEKTPTVSCCDTDKGEKTENCCGEEGDAEKAETVSEKSNEDIENEETNPVLGIVTDASILGEDRPASNSSESCGVELEHTEERSGSFSSLHNEENECLSNSGNE